MAGIAIGMAAHGCDYNDLGGATSGALQANGARDTQAGIVGGSVGGFVGGRTAAFFARGCA